MEILSRAHKTAREIALAGPGVADSAPRRRCAGDRGLQYPTQSVRDLVADDLLPRASQSSAKAELTAA